MTRGKPRRVTYVAGVDVSIRDGKAVAAIAVLRLPELELIDQSVASRPVEFPYVPGLLSFREIPVVLDALRNIETIPDVILCDGQGIAHPRRFGIASHLGVLTGLRTIGVAKSRLIGSHEDVPARKGEWIQLYDGDETIGSVLRTREGIKPLFISIGHRVNLASALDVVMRCVTRYRLPETTRWAHKIAGDHNLIK